MILPMKLPALAVLMVTAFLLGALAQQPALTPLLSTYVNGKGLLSAEC
jgi:hypothetical protein